jgi:hypothetical protein
MMINMYFPYIILLLISSVNSKVNIRHPFSNFQDITNSTVTPSPTPVEIQQDPIIDQTPSPAPVEIQQDPIIDQIPSPAPVDTPIVDQIPDEIQPADTQQDTIVNNTTEIIINPTPSSIDPEISKQLTHIYKISVGTFVILFLILIIVFGVICRMCYNRY